MKPVKDLTAFGRSQRNEGNDAAPLVSVVGDVLEELSGELRCDFRYGCSSPEAFELLVAHRAFVYQFKK